jgi:Undecaprenyl-phosphate galactose phosphotransferase WbaP
MPDMHTRETEIGTGIGRGSGQIFSGVRGEYTVSNGRELLRKAKAGPQRLFRYRVIKRMLDVAFIVLCSPILILVTAAIAVAIRISSPGPIFFTHRRIRRHGAFFSMWKFRTMCVNSAEVLHEHLRSNPEAYTEWLQSHKLRNDPRITGVGAFLRKTSLDELPQMWNVLTGSMSLVGPRPIVAAEVEKYGEYFADYCMVTPGLTGLWQVSGRSDTSYKQRLALDRQYVQNWSLTNDALILAKTLTTVVKQHGAF